MKKVSSEGLAKENKKYDDIYERIE